MTDQPLVPNVQVSTVHEAQGLRPKAVAWLIFAALAVGIGIGVGASARFLRYESSPEFVAEQQVLRGNINAIGDSLVIAQSDYDSISAAVENLERDLGRVTDERDSAREMAAASSSRADSVSSLYAGTENPDTLYVIIGVEREARRDAEYEAQTASDALDTALTVISELREANSVLLKRDRLWEAQVTDYAVAIEGYQAELQRTVGRMNRGRLYSVKRAAIGSAVGAGTGVVAAGSCAFSSSCNVSTAPMLVGGLAGAIAFYLVDR